MTGHRSDRPEPSHLGWCWSVSGAAGIEDSREAAEAQINRHRKPERLQ